MTKRRSTRLTTVVRRSEIQPVLTETKANVSKQSRNHQRSIMRHFLLPPSVQNPKGIGIKEFLLFIINTVVALLLAFSQFPVAWKWAGWMCCLALLCWSILQTQVADRLTSVAKYSIIGLVIVFTCFLSARTFASQLHEEKAQAFEGLLIASGPMNPRPEMPSNFYAMRVGFQPNAFFVSIDPNKAQGFVDISGDELSLKESSRKASLNTLVRDTRGNIAVDISDNHWKVSKDSTVVWDKNFRSDRLEVLDGKEQVILSVQLFTDGMKIEGDWHNEYGESFRMYDVDGKHSELTSYGSGVREPRNEIKRQFLYPSKDHLGQLVNR